jgi:SAM-dependent methyltransferase
VSEKAYLLSNQATEAGSRFDALSSLFDPATCRHIDGFGIRPGWRCWEVGAGGPSVLQWLAGRVGTNGQVLATDIDISWAQQAAGRPIEVRKHDVALDEPPQGPFDLVHARLVLIHVPDRERALRNMARALRPGGWLFVEDADPALQPLSCLDVQGPDQALANKIRTGFRALLAQRGVDLAYGRKLPRLLREAGLKEVAADAYFPVALPACGPLETATINLIRPRLIEHGIATESEIERHLANVASGKLDLTQPPMISAWGRKG